MTRKWIAWAAAVVMLSGICPADAQFAGRTCGPNGCHLVLPPPPPSATPFVQWVCGGKGMLGIGIVWLNGHSVPVPIASEIDDAALSAGDKVLHPTFTTDAQAGTIAPDSFTMRIFYHAAIRDDLPQSFRLAIGQQMAVAIDLKQLNPCP